MEHESKKKVTLKDIAARTGLSVNTVSRVLNKKPYYTKEVELTLASGDAFCEPRKNGVESFINAYRKRLGTELDTSFFQRLPNMTFSTNEKDGSTVSRTYASNGILLQQNKQFYETKGVRGF